MATAAASMTSWSQLQAGWPSVAPCPPTLSTKVKRTTVLKSLSSVKDMEEQGCLAGGLAVVLQMWTLD